MKRITLDRVTIEKLGPLSERVEICDESGRVLGEIVPAATAAKYSGEPYVPDFTDEEIAQLRQQQGGRPLAEIWQSLDRTT